MVESRPLPCVKTVRCDTGHHGRSRPISAVHSIGTHSNKKPFKPLVQFPFSHVRPAISAKSNRAQISRKRNPEEMWSLCITAFSCLTFLIGKRQLLRSRRDWLPSDFSARNLFIRLNGFLYVFKSSSLSASRGRSRPTYLAVFLACRFVRLLSCPLRGRHYSCRRRQQYGAKDDAIDQHEEDDRGSRGCRPGRSGCVGVCHRLQSSVSTLPSLIPVVQIPTAPWTAHAIPRSC